MKLRFFAPLLLLAGCADIEAARRVQDRTTARPGERTVTAQEIGLTEGSKLPLERGIDLALTHNPAAAISRARSEASQARLEQADAGFLPQIFLGVNYTWQKNGGPGSTPLGGSKIFDGVVQSHGGQVTLNQYLFDFGRTDAVRRQSYESFVASQHDFRATQNDVAFAFRQAFFTVLKQEELVRVGEATVRQFTKRLQQVQGLVDVGSRQKYDLTKAQVDLGGAELALVKARTALTLNRAILNNALGLTEDPKYVLDKPEKVGEWTMSFDDAFQAARQNHPRILAFLLREYAASSAIDIAIADYYPNISFSAAVSWSGSLTPLSWFSSLGPDLAADLFTGGKKTGFLRESVASLREAYASRTREEQAIYLDLRNAFAQLADARESEKIATLTVKQATENLTLVQGRFDAGRASSVELTDAQVALANARASEIEARWDLEIAIAALRRAVGENRSQP